MNGDPAKIRWGVLGYARIARDSVMPAIVRSSNSLLHAVASRQEENLAACGAKFSTPALYGEYDDLLRDPNVDAVYIPLPNSMHRDWAIKAAEHGKHVLCEKPLCLTAAEGREMAAASSANNVLLMEAFMYRYTDRTRQVLEILRGGALGEINFVSSTFRFFYTNQESIKFKPELGGGSLYDAGCYPVNFIGLVLDEVCRGRPGETVPHSISAQAVRQGGVDISYSAILKYASGLIANVNSGYNSQKWVHSEVGGTRGALLVPDTFFDNAGALTLITGQDRREIPVAESDRYRLEVEDFADAVLSKRAPRLSLTETLRNIEVMERLQAAAK